MARKTVALVGLLIAASWSPQVCQANNNLFLPGDAFFPTVLTKGDVEAIQKAKSGERKFAYSSFGGYEGAFCGYAGYRNATIPTVDDDFAKNLARVYHKIREFEGRKLVEWTTDGKTELIETNGIRVLFYPPEFKFPEHGLGLRYNENWVAECVKFGHRRKDLRLCPLIDDPDAVALSWRDADLVPGLKVELPKVPLQAVPPTEEPVVVRGGVTAFVIGSPTLKEIFECSHLWSRRSDAKHDTDLTVYVVDSKGITELVHKEGKWNARDFE